MFYKRKFRVWKTACKPESRINEYVFNNEQYFFTPLHLFRPFSERKPQEIFPYVLSMESSIQYLDSVKYHWCWKMVHVISDTSRFCAFLSKLVLLNNRVCDAINKHNIFLFLKCLIENYLYFSIPYISYSTLAVDWLKDTHQGRVEALVWALSFHQCGLDLILAQSLYVMLVCWFSTVLQEVVPWFALGSSPHQKPKIKICYATVLRQMHRDLLLLLEY